MTAPISSLNPQRFTRGDTCEWYESHTHYPAPTWVLTVAFAKFDDSQLITAADNGDGRHLVTIDDAASAEFKPGKYRYQIKVTDGANTYTLEMGDTTVLEDFASVVSGHDSRPWAEQALEKLRDVLLTRAGRGQGSLTVAGQQMTWDSIGELRELEADLAWRVRRLRDRERISQGRGRLTVSQTRFVR